MKYIRVSIQEIENRIAMHEGLYRHDQARALRDFFSNVISEERIAAAVAEYKEIIVHMEAKEK